MQQVLEFAAEVNLGDVVRRKVAPAVLVPAHRTGKVICEHWDGDNVTVQARMRIYCMRALAHVYVRTCVRAQ